MSDEPIDPDAQYRPARITLAVIFGLALVYLLLTRPVVDYVDLGLGLTFVAGMVAVTLKGLR